MLALQVTSMKHFMNQLLTTDTFDIFLLEEATVTTANTVRIDGHLNREFYSPEELSSGQVPDYEFTPWSNIKGLCFNLIKGKHTPLYFKFVFHLKPELAARLLEREECSVEPSQLKALVLTVTYDSSRYDGAKAVLTTGSAFHTFVMSKEPDRIWDRILSGYLTRKDIPYENLV